MTDESESARLQPFVDCLETGNPFGHRNLTLVPLGGEGHKCLDYILVADAIEAGTLTVTEVSEQGNVNELMVTSKSDKMILMLDGEELVGAKQNRILNTTVLLAPKAKTRIPVSCVEQGRWRYTTGDFKSGNYAAPQMRSKKCRSVSRSLQTSGRAESNQNEVWDEVEKQAMMFEAEAPTMAMKDVVDQQKDSLQAYLAALEYPQGTRGLVAAINGRFIAMDLFDRAGTLERIWDKLVTGYAMDAMGQLGGRSKQFTAKSIRFFLDGMVYCELGIFSAVGIGKDWRFQSNDILGQALVAEQSCVHMSIFPNNNDDQGHNNRSENWIMPPSYRRRHGRGTI